MMTWKEFLDTADRLTAGMTEGDWRSSVSRAYYAVFHYFRDFLLAHGIDLGKAGDVHQTLKIGLLYCGIGPVNAIGQEVERLNEARSRADYRFVLTVTQQDAKDAVHSARRIVSGFGTLLTGTPAATIAAAIRAYLIRIRRISP
jgi:uncharacterized protein (UPF0332 family)